MHVTKHNEKDRAVKRIRLIWGNNNNNHKNNNNNNDDLNAVILLFFRYKILRQ
jgi:hypothetical protein